MNRVVFYTLRSHVMYVRVLISTRILFLRDLKAQQKNYLQSKKAFKKSQIKFCYSNKIIVGIKFADFFSSLIYFCYFPWVLQSMIGRAHNILYFLIWLYQIRRGNVRKKSNSAWHGKFLFQPLPLFLSIHNSHVEVYLLSVCLTFNQWKIQNILLEIWKNYDEERRERREDWEARTSDRPDLPQRKSTAHKCRLPTERACVMNFKLLKSRMKYFLSINFYSSVSSNCYHKHENMNITFISSR